MVWPALGTAVLNHKTRSLQSIWSGFYPLVESKVAVVPWQVPQEQVYILQNRINLKL